MSLRLGIVMDPIAGISFKKDSSLAMLLAAQARGWSLFYMEQQDLYQSAGVARAKMRPLQVFANPEKWFELDAEIDTLFDKFRPNAFHGTDLARQLQGAQVEELYVVGMKSQFCIDSTCRSAADLGFRPLLVSDAHTCMDTAALPAAAIIQHHNATLGAAFARLINCAEVTF